jgi:hypothetical protein
MTTVKGSREMVTRCEARAVGDFGLHHESLQKALLLSFPSPPEGV